MALRLKLERPCHGLLVHFHGFERWLASMASDEQFEGQAVASLNEEPLSETGVHTSEHAVAVVISTSQAFGIEA